MRPTSDQVTFVQLDDLDTTGLSRVGEFAFMTLETSPGNHQAWIAVSGLSTLQEAKDFARRLRKGTGADLTASGATRVAGTFNYKRKYEPEFPTVTIRESSPGKVITTAQLESRGLVVAPEPVAVLPSACPAEAKPPSAPGNGRTMAVAFNQLRPTTAIPGRIRAVPTSHGV